MELVAVIPQDYDDLPEPLRRRIIPICIATFDRLGKPINPEWFSQGVVSELAEETVHRLSMLYGSVIPSYPARRVLKKANRLAVEINVGDWRKRKHPKLYVELDGMDAKVRDRALADPSQCPAVFEQQILLNSIEDRLGQEAQTGMQLIYQLLRRGFSWQDIAQTVGEASPDAVKHRFHRWARKAGAA
jgi:hypothetical protein